jgi:hypothetical protein
MPRARLRVTAGVPPIVGRRDLPCRTVHPDLFFSDLPAEQDKARALCTECPVRFACLQAAVDLDLSFGIWAGHTPDERRAIKTRWDRDGAATEQFRPTSSDPHGKPQPADRPWSWPGAKRAVDPHRMFDAAADHLAGDTLRDVAARWGIQFAKAREAALIARWAPDLVEHVKNGLVRDTVAARYAEKVRDAHRAAQRMAA